MAKTPRTQETKPQDGIADAVHDLTDQTQLLVRREIEAARRETLAKARESAPGIALLAANGVLGLLAAGSAYRLSLRLLEKRLPRPTAALIAAAGYGAAAAGAGLLAVLQLRQAPLPLPTQTAQAAGDAMADAGGRAESQAAP